MLGTLIHYLRGTRIMMFQLSGFYYIGSTLRPMYILYEYMDVGVVWCLGSGCRIAQRSQYP